MKWLRNPWLLGVVGVVLALVTNGIRFGAGDQQLYVPYIQHAAHPELYPHDYIFASDNYRATIFIPLMGALHRRLGGELGLQLAIVQLCSLWLFFAMVARLTARVTVGAAPAWLVVFLSWPPPVPGTGMSLWDPEPHPRNVAVALALAGLDLILDGKTLIAALVEVVALLIHPLLGLGAIVGTAAASTRRQLPRFLGAIVLLYGVSHFFWHGQSSELPLQPAAWWQAIAEHRYLWVQRWPPMVYLATLVWIALYLVCRPRVSDEKITRLERFGLAALALFALAVIGSFARSPLLVALQLGRSLYTILVVALIFIARRLDEDREAGRLPWPIFAVTALLPMTHSLLFPFFGIAVALVWARISRPLPSWLAWIAAAALLAIVPLRFRAHLQPRPSPDWLALQDWARTQTPVDALFVAPQHEPDFRVYSERGSVLGVQDPQPAIFNHGFADEWLARLPVTADYARRDCAALDRDGARFGATFVITEWDCAAQPPVERIGPFRVYRNPDAK